MFFLKSAYCRVFQTAFRLALPLLPYREPDIIHSCSDLGSVCKKEKAASVLIVTDKGIVKNGLTAPAEEAFRIYRENGCSCLIAIGGGSAMDCAKAVGARAAYPKRSIAQLKGILKIHRRLPTLIAIPTTAGTGSEVTVAAIITDSEKHTKNALMSFPLIPKYAVLDAALTYSLPPHLTSTTGIDALTHAVEAYIGRSTTKETRQLSLDAVKLVFGSIETAYTDGRNHDARENMLHAAFKAGEAFSKSYVGYIHAVAHSLGGQYGTPHGLANAVILPYVLEAYGSSVHKKLRRLGIAAGVCSENDSPESGAKKFIDGVKALNARLNIPDKLQGIAEEDIPVMAVHAEKEANPLYPVPKLMTRKELESFYYQIADWSAEQ